jgi:hypothetical protein
LTPPGKELAFVSAFLYVEETPDVEMLSFVEQHAILLEGLFEFSNKLDAFIQ